MVRRSAEIVTWCTIHFRRADFTDYEHFNEVANLISRDKGIDPGMVRRVVSACALALCFLLVPLGLQARDLYVSPQGTASGPGTQAQPYDLATALYGAAGQAGDTFWMLAGTYALGHVDTKIAGAPGAPITL